MNYDMTDANIAWTDAEAIAAHARSVLLYGDPGIGKSHLARTAGLRYGQALYEVPITPDTPAAEIRGHYVQTAAGYEWVNGPGISAWRFGGRLVLDEIDKLGDDGLAFALALLDNPETASMHLYQTGEVLKPHPDFTCWATMNGTPDDLTPALRDRFPVSIHVTRPHPDAIARLSPDLRTLAESLSVAQDDRRVGLRQFLAYDMMRRNVEPEIAARTIFGAHWRGILDGIALAAAADVR